MPDGYDERLRVEYGEYMVLKKIPSTHGNVILEPDIPYKEYLKTHDAGEELRKIAAAAEEEKESSAFRHEYTIMEKPDWISYDEIAELLHDALGDGGLAAAGASGDTDRDDIHGVPPNVWLDVL